jgi:hypothetical protein
MIIFKIENGKEYKNVKEEALNELLSEYKNFNEILNKPIIFKFEDENKEVKEYFIKGMDIEFGKDNITLLIKEYKGFNSLIEK